MQDKFTAYQKLVIALLAITQFTVVLDFMVMAPLGDFMMKSLKITPAEFGLAVSAYAFSAGISGLMAAGFADKYDRKKLLLFFYVGFIVGTFCCALAPNYPALLVARILTGIFGGVISSIAMAIVADLFEFGHRGRVMGFLQTGFSASQVLGIPVGLYLANLWDWHAPFFMIVGLGIVLAGVIWRGMRPVDQHLGQHTERRALTHLLKTVSMPAYRLAFMTTALLSIGGFLLMPFSSAFLVNNIGIAQAQLPIIFMVTGLFTLVMMPLIGKFSDRIDKFRLFTFGSFWAIIWMIVYTNLTPVPLWVVLVINVLLFVGIMSRMVPAMAIMSAVPALHDRGAFMSVNSSLQQIAGGVASAFAGLIIVQADEHSPLQHYPVLGFIGSGVVLVCVWLMSRIKRARQQPAEMAAPAPEAVLENN